MAQQNIVYVTSSGDLIRAGAGVVAEAGETLRTDGPVPAFTRYLTGASQMHRWDGSAYVLVDQPSMDGNHPMSMDIANLIEDTSPDADNDFVAVLDASAGKVKKAKLKNLGGGGGPPGTWTQLLDSNASVAFNTTVTLGTVTGIADGEVLVAYVTMRDNINGFLIYQAASAGDDEAAFFWEKTSTDGQWKLRIHHQRIDESGITVDFRAYKVT